MDQKTAVSKNRGLGGAVRRSAERGADVAKLEARIRSSRIPTIDDLTTGLFAKPRVGQDLLRRVAKQDILTAGSNAVRRNTPTPPPMPIANRLEAFKLDRFAKGERNPAALRYLQKDPRIAKLLAGLGIGAGATLTAGGLGLGGAVQDAGSAIGGAATSLVDKVRGLASSGEAMAQPTTVDPSSIHNADFGGGIGETLWRNAPLLGGLGAAGLGAYGLYRNYKKQQAKRTLPTIDMMPKTAAERRQFADDHPLVAGFLIACSRAGLDELRIREKIAIACRTDEDIAEEFHAAFTKYAVGMFPSFGGGSNTDAPSFSEMAAKLPPKPPTPVGALDQGPTAPPTPAPLTPRPAGPMPDGSLLADQPPPSPSTPALSPAEQLQADQDRWQARMRERMENDPRVQLNRDIQQMPAYGASSAQSAAANPPRATGERNLLGMKPILPESYRQQFRGFYVPGSREWENGSPQDETLKNIGRVGMVAGVGSGLALPAAIAAAPAAAAAPAVAAATPAAATTAAVPAAGLGARLGTRLLGAAKNPWTIPKAVATIEVPSAAFGTLGQLENPDGMSTDWKDYSLTGAATRAVQNKLNLGSARNFKAEGLSPESLAAIEQEMQQNLIAMQAKFPEANQDWLKQQVEKDRSTLVQQYGLRQEVAKLQQTTNMPPQQLQEGLTKAEQQGIDPQTEAKAGENFVKAKTEEAIKQTGAPPPPEAQAGWMEQFQAMPTGAKWLLGIGAGLGLIGLLSSFSDEGGGLAGSLALLLGGGLAAGAAAHGGLMGKDIQGATQAITSPMSNLLGNNIQPLSGDQQRMLAAVRGADLDRYQQLRSGTNPNIPQAA